jgi:hypothetical protein
MTPFQRHLARLALGLPNATKRSYRNRYVAAPNTTEYDGWEQMVAAGLAVKTPGGEMGLGQNDHFRLTHRAAVEALEPNESLDREDFPSGADFVESKGP